MLRRSVRVGLVLLTVALTAAAVWRATSNELQRGRTRLVAQQDDAAVAEAIFGLADLRASIFATLVPSQGDFWPARAAEQIDDLRTRLIDIDAQSSAAGFPLAASLDRLDRVAAAAIRARQLTEAGRVTDAAPVALNDARELIEAMTSDLSAARQFLARAAASREAGMANELSLLAGAVMSLWIATLVVLVPVPRAPAPVAPATLSLRPDAVDSDHTMVADAVGASSLREAVDDAVDLAAITEPEPAETTFSNDVVAQPVAEAAAVAATVSTAAAPVDLPALADLCGSLGRVSDAADLPPLLARAATVLGARGIVVWLADEEGTNLVPAVAHGYDVQVLARVGALDVAEDNLTARAFRTGEPTFTAATDAHAAAVAVPLLPSGGASGVLAAELHDSSQPATAGALAAVMAAQLANLFPAPVKSEV